MAAEPKVLINFRTPVAAREWLDGVAEHHRVDRSDVIRAALALARKQPEVFGKLIEERR